MNREAQDKGENAELITHANAAAGVGRWARQFDEITLLNPGHSLSKPWPESQYSGP